MRPVRIVFTGMWILLLVALGRDGVLKQLPWIEASRKSKWR